MPSMFLEARRDMVGGKVTDPIQLCLRPCLGKQRSCICNSLRICSSSPLGPGHRASQAASQHHPPPPPIPPPPTPQPAHTPQLLLAPSLPPLLMLPPLPFRHGDECVLWMVWRGGWVIGWGWWRRWWCVS